MTKPPIPETEESGPFWEGCREGRLRYQHCGACGRAQFPPRAFCAACGAREIAWRDSTGCGRVHSYTLVHRAPGDWVSAPYLLALVDLEEGFRLMVNLRDCAESKVGIGAPVRIVFEAWDGATKLPQARLDR